jgi:hypothetical protein
VLILRIALAEDEGVLIEDNLAVDVFYDDEERLRTTVDTLIPLEVGDDREVNPDERASDRLNLRLQPVEPVKIGVIERDTKTYWSLGKLCTRRWTRRPACGMPISSPISGGFWCS